MERNTIQDFTNYCFVSENIVIKVKNDNGKILYDGKVCGLYDADKYPLMGRRVIRLGCTEDICGDTVLALCVE